MMTKNISAAFAAALALGFAPSCADAAVIPVAWVSTQGVDSANCGAITGPCRTFQYTHNNIVADHGTILVRDAGSFGPLVIGKSVSIINQNGAVAGIFAPAGSAIEIQAGPYADVVLKGLTLDGAGQGTLGVRATSVRNLTIADCTIEGFTNTGIQIVPQASETIRFVVTDSLVTGNTFTNIFVQPNYNLPNSKIGSASASGVIKNTTVTVANTGVWAASSKTTGSVRLSIDDSVVANHSSIGIHIQGAAVTLTADRLDSSFNNTGLFAFSAKARLSRSKLTDNTTSDTSKASGGVIQSYGDNQIGIMNNGAVAPIGYK